MLKEQVYVVWIYVILFTLMQTFYQQLGHFHKFMYAFIKYLNLELRIAANIVTVLLLYYLLGLILSCNYNQAKVHCFLHVKFLDCYV
jgi:hypothetical protein